MYCFKCGKELPEDAQFCSKCGTSQASTAALGLNAPASGDHNARAVDIASESPSVVDSRSILGKSSPMACPHCWNLDKVERITSLVEQNTTDSSWSSVSTGRATTIGYSGDGLLVGRTYAGGKATSRGTSQSRTAQRVSPPIQPTFQSPWGVGKIFMLLILGFIAAGGLMSLGTNASAAFIGIVCLVILVFWWWRTLQESKRRLEGYSYAKSRWEKAAKRWIHLFYCSRCDGVFVPGEGRFVPSSQINGFLYE